MFPPQASTNAASIDLLTVVLTLVTLVFSLLIGVAIVVMAVKYRRGRKVDRSNPPHEGLLIETIWTLIPFGIAMGLFVWATTLYFSNLRPPADSMEIYVTGKQWMWKIQHPEGRWEMNELHVPLGRNVKLTMTSEDVIHSFFVPAFRIKMDVVPGRYTQMWFKPTKIGKFHLFCAEFCGTNHAGMVGSVIVQTPEDYQRWLRTGNAPESLASAGEKLFRQHGCGGCHSRNSSLRAPVLDGIYGKTVAIQIPRAGVPLSEIQSTTVIADDRYIHDSITLPEQEVAAGYKPIMPTFQGRLSEGEIMQLIAYIKSLGTSNGGYNGSSRGDNMGTVTPDQIEARTGFTPRNMGDINRASQANPGAAPGFRNEGNRQGTQGAGGVRSDVQRNVTGAPPTSSVPEAGTTGAGAPGGAGTQGMTGGTEGAQGTNNGRTAQ